MIEKLRESRGRQLLFITVLILLVPLMADISGRMAVLRRMHQEKARLNQILLDAHTEREELKTRLEFVNDEAYLERWARVEARMALPGEVAIIPIIAEKTEQGFTALEGKLSPSKSSMSVPDQWRRLFFDDLTGP